MTTIALKPKETRQFQNENLVRLRPVANSASSPFNPSIAGVECEFLLTPKAQTLLDTNVNLVNNMGALANALPIVSLSSALQGIYQGEDMANGAYTLRGGAVLAEPSKLALIFIQATASEFTVQIDGLDETSSAVSETFILQTDGIGPHITAALFKQVTAVTGSGLVGGGASDEIYIGPAIPNNLAGHVGQSGRAQSGPASDLNDAANDGDASYAECADTVNRDAFCSLATIPRLLSLSAITFSNYTKQIGAGAGVELRVRFSTNPSVSYKLAENTATGSEAGVSTLTTFSLTTIDGGPVNPATGNRMTVAEFNTMEVGVRFLGDGGSIPKRWQFLRIQVTGRLNPALPGIDESDPAFGFDHWKAVNQDPFGTPNDSQFVECVRTQGTQPLFQMENLPAQAVGVNSVRASLRITQMNFGTRHGSGPNDFPCAVGTLPRANTAEWTYTDGPLEQTNDGGWRVRIGTFPATLDSARFATGPGDPSGGCGTFFNFAGENVGFGNFVTKELFSTVNSSSAAISVANANAMEVGAVLEDGRAKMPYRMSRVYAEVEYLRNPNGNSTIFHFAVDDDLGAPDDTNFMESQHSSNKRFSVDFPSIPEVSRISNVLVQARAMTNPGATAGWRIILQLNGSVANEQIQATQLNTSFETRDFNFNVSPFSTLEWTREEINNLVVVWEAIGENDYHPKRLSALGVTVEADLIPDKIDAARDIASRKIRLFRRPRPFLTVQLPIRFLDAGLLGDVSVIHNAIPRVEKTLGFERWDRSLMRVFKETIDLNRDLITLTVLDLREFLTTLWITGRATGKGQSAEGMAILTPGVTLSFTRRTNDYLEDPFAGLIQELAADEPPQGLEGILIQSGTINRVFNSAFTEGATDVFTSWTKTIEGAGGSIVEDLLDLAFDQNAPDPPRRSVRIVGANGAPTDAVYLRTQPLLEHGKGLSPADSRHSISILHKDDSAQPLSVAISVLPTGFGESFYDWRDEGWSTSGGLVWQTLPVRATRTRDSISGNLRNIEDVPGLDNPEHAIRLNIGARTSPNQINHLYAVQVEGGAIANQNDRAYRTNFVQTKTGQVIRDGLQFFVPNFRTRPSYPAELRGTCFLQILPIWDSAQLPAHTGARRYIYSLEVDGDNHDKLWYDSDAEKFIFERKIAGTALSVEFRYPQITKDDPIGLTTRWVSSLGDLDLAPFSFTIFVNGEQGTTNAHAQKFPLPSESKLWLGSNNGAESGMLDGTIRNLNIVPFALPQSRIRRLP